MGTSKRLASLYGREARAAAVIHRPELDHAEHPIYPRPKKVRAWVRFGPESVRVEASLMGSTPLAAGIEFKAGDQILRCWVWGNAVALALED